MACISASAAHSPASRQRCDDTIAKVILQLSSENEALTEEVRQLRAAIQVYSALAERLRGNQGAGRGYHGTV
jgi:hypothetical protein